MPPTVNEIACCDAAFAAAAAVNDSWMVSPVGFCFTVEKKPVSVSLQMESITITLTSRNEFTIKLLKKVRRLTTLLLRNEQADVARRRIRSVPCLVRNSQ